MIRKQKKKKEKERKKDGVIVRNSLGYRRKRKKVNVTFPRLVSNFL